MRLQAPLLLLLACSALACDSKPKPPPSGFDSVPRPADEADSVVAPVTPPIGDTTQVPVAPDDTAQVEISRGLYRTAMYGVARFDAVRQGDTLNYTARWPKFPGATAYKYGVRSNPTGAKYKWWLSTTGKLLPSNATVVDSFVKFSLIDTTGWDSTSFRFVVWGTNSAGTSEDSLQIGWRVTRVAPPTVPPGPPSIDSSQAVRYQQIVVRPASVNMAASTEECRTLASPVDSAGNVKRICKDGTGAPMVVQWCLYVQLRRPAGVDPLYYFTPGQDRMPKCREYYQQFAASNRPAATAVNAYPLAKIPAAAPPLPVIRVTIGQVRTSYVPGTRSCDTALTTAGPLDVCVGEVAGALSVPHVELVEPDINRPVPVQPAYDLIISGR